MAWTLPEFTHAMAANPAPASGSAAATAVAMAAALVEKVANRSKQCDDAPALAARAAAVRGQALALVNADYEAVVEMLRRGEPGEQAIAVPTRIGELAREVRDIAVDLEKSGNPALLADSIGARELARAAESTVNEILRSNA